MEKSNDKWVYYKNADPIKLSNSIDEVLTILGGTEISEQKGSQNIYDIAFKGTAIVATFNNYERKRIKEETGEMLTGSVQLIGFKEDKFYEKLYSALKNLQQ
jgi:hypothetical protein